jgi:hypothetical protein
MNVSYTTSRFRSVSLTPTGRVLSSQTIGVEFASKIVKVGTGSRRKRIKFQVSCFLDIWSVENNSGSVLTLRPLVAALGHSWDRTLPVCFTIVL